MIIGAVTIIYQCGTEFRLDLLSLQKKKSPILKEEAPQAWR